MKAGMKDLLAKDSAQADDRTSGKKTPEKQM